MNVFHEQSTRDIDAAMAKAADRVRNWLDSRLNDDAVNITRLYRGARDRLLYRLRMVYEGFLKDDPTIRRARHGVGTYIDSSIDATVRELADYIGQTSVAQMTTMLSDSPAVLGSVMQRTPFAEMPYAAQRVLDELTTTTVGGGTFWDHMMHVTDTLKADVTRNVRSALVHGSDFDTLRRALMKSFGVDKLSEPKSNAYGAVKVYKNSARRQWNLLMRDIGRREEGVLVWWAMLDDRTTPGCAVRHGVPIDELGEMPPRHFNCRCTAAVFPSTAGLATYRMDGTAWLKANGYTRRAAQAEESGWGWGHDTLVPVARVREDASRFHEYTSVSRRDLPTLVINARHAPWQGNLEAVLTRANSDHVLLRRSRSSRETEVYVLGGWRPLRPRLNERMIETARGIVADSPTITAPWDVRANVRAVVACFVDGKVWAIRPSDHANVWVLPGGHVEAGEDLRDAAVREMREETGVPVRILKLLGTLRRGLLTTSAIFLAEQIAPREAPATPDEIAEAALVDIDKLVPDHVAFIRSYVHDNDMRDKRAIHPRDTFAEANVHSSAVYMDATVAGGGIEPGIEHYPDSEHDETRTGQDDLDEFGFGLFDDDDELPEKKDLEEAFDPNQPRDDRGRWAPHGGSGERYSKDAHKANLEAVFNYGGESYISINEYLRTGKGFGKKDAIALSHAFNDRQIFKTAAEPKTVWRGMHGAKIYGMFKDAKVGQTFVDKAFLSTTTSKVMGTKNFSNAGGGQSVAMQITMGTGTKYIPVESMFGGGKGIPENENEHEWLLDRQTPLKIASVEKVKGLIVVRATVGDTEAAPLQFKVTAPAKRAEPTVKEDPKLQNLVAKIYQKISDELGNKKDKKSWDDYHRKLDKLYSAKSVAQVKSLHLAEAFNPDEARDERGRWVYHGTSSEAIKSILKSGLVWGKGQVHWMQSQRGRVYVTSSQAEAVYWGDQHTGGEKGHVAILKILVPGDHATQLRKDRNSGTTAGALRFDGKIPPEWIKQVWVSKLPAWQHDPTNFLATKGPLKTPLRGPREWKALKKEADVPDHEVLYIAVTLPHGQQMSYTPQQASEAFDPNEKRDDRGRWTASGNEIASRARHSKDLIQGIKDRGLVTNFATHNYMTGPENISLDGLRKGFQGHWNDEHAWLLRAAAAQEFGGGLPSSTKVGGVPVSTPQAVYAQVLKGASKAHTDVAHVEQTMRTYVRALHAYTQRQLADAPDTITLYRGVDVGKHKDAAVGQTIQYRPISLLSMSSDPKIASSPMFGDMTLQFKVPKSQVLANHSTGLGKGSQKEWLVLGGSKPISAKVVFRRSSKASEAGFDPEQHPRKPKGDPHGGEFAKGKGGSASLGDVKIGDKITYKDFKYNNSTSSWSAVGKSGIVVGKPTGGFTLDVDGKPVSIDSSWVTHVNEQPLKSDSGGDKSDDKSGSGDKSGGWANPDAPLSATKTPPKKFSTNDPMYQLGANATDGVDLVNKISARAKSSYVQNRLKNFRAAWNIGADEPEGMVLRAAASEMWGGTVYGNSKNYGAGRSALAQFVEQPASVSDDMQSYIKALYGLTQKSLVADGKKTLTLYRGFGESERAAAAANEKDWRVGDRVEFKTGSLSSFSTDKETSKMFGPYTVRVRVRTPSVLSYYRTGPGHAGEREYLVIGNHTKFFAHVVRSPKGTRTKTSETERGETPYEDLIDLDAYDEDRKWIESVARRRRTQEAFNPDQKRDDHGRWTAGQPLVSVSKEPFFDRYGKRVPIKNHLNKPQTGALAERVVLSFLQRTRKFSDAKFANIRRKNYPIDIVADGWAIEVKAGLVSIKRNSRQWRLTQGEPSPADKETIANMSAARRAVYGSRKDMQIMVRKQRALRELQRDEGIKLEPMTITCVVNPDTKRVDMYRFSGFHKRIGWMDKKQDFGKAFVRSVKYKGPNVFPKVTTKTSEVLTKVNAPLTELTDEQRYWWKDAIDAGVPMDLILHTQKEIDEYIEDWKQAIIRIKGKQA